jgi:3-oxoacyl-[acyl-carrier protein] reductase
LEDFSNELGKKVAMYKIVKEEKEIEKKPKKNISEEDWNFTIDTNLKGTYYCCKAVCPEMIKRRKGRIINISSIAGTVGFPGMGPYGAAKAGIIQIR